MAWWVTVPIVLGCWMGTGMTQTHETSNRFIIVWGVFMGHILDPLVSLNPSLISHVYCTDSGSFLDYMFSPPNKKKHYFKRFSYFIRPKLCRIVLTSIQKTFVECCGHVTRHELNRSFMAPHTSVHGIIHLQTPWNYGNLSVKVSRTIV